MDGISLSWRILPQSLIDSHGLQDRVIVRSEGADREFRFLYRDPRPVLPVWYGEELRLMNWGHPPRSSPLPRSRVIAHETLAAGEWRELEPESIEIPASFGWDKGIWFRIIQGAQGVLVRERDGTPIVYVVTRAATHYYQIMTRNNRQPLLIDQTI